MSAIVSPHGRYFSSKEAAEYLGMPIERLRRLRAANKIPFIYDGRLAFLQRDLDEWIERRRTPAIDERKSKRVEVQRGPTGPADISDLMPKRPRLSIAG